MLSSAADNNGDYGNLFLSVRVEIVVTLRSVVKCTFNYITELIVFFNCIRINRFFYDFATSC